MMKLKRKRMFVNALTFVLITLIDENCCTEKTSHRRTANHILASSTNSIVAAANVMETNAERSQKTNEDNITVKNESAELIVNRTQLLNELRENNGSTTFINSTDNTFCLKTVLNVNEYSIENGWLLTIYDKYKFSAESYSIDDDGNAALCYPFSDNFKKCYPNVWQLTKQEYEYINNTKNIINKITNDVYLLGNYIPKAKGIFVCIPQDALKYNRSNLHIAQRILMLIGYSLSFTALLLSIIIYLVLPTKQYDSRPLFCHMVSMFCVYFILLLHQIRNSFSTPVCYLIAVTYQFGFLAAFSWLNVVAFELWSRFRANAAVQTLPSKRPCITFFYRSMYGWGVPLTIISVSLAVEFATNSPLKPFYDIICMMTERAGKWLFLYGPIATMLLINFTFFIFTICNLHRAGQEIALANSKIHRQLLAMYFKLIFVMGISWIFEVLSWAIGPIPEYWILTDMINAVQGVFIFFIYCFKRSVLDNFQKKFPRCVKLFKRPKFLQKKQSGNSFGSITSTATVSTYI